MLAGSELSQSFDWNLSGQQNFGDHLKEARKGGLPKPQRQKCGGYLEFQQAVRRAARK